LPGKKKLKKNKKSPTKIQTTKQAEGEFLLLLSFQIAELQP